MNVCVPYAVAYALLALTLRRRGHYWASRAMWIKVWGLAALAPIVFLTDSWPFWGSLIWTLVAVEMTKLAGGGKIPRLIPNVGYALAGSYWLHLIDSFHMLPITHVPTWVSAAIGVAMAALICGPLAHDAARGLFNRLDRLVARHRARRAFLRGASDDGGLLALPETEDGAQGAR